MTDQDLHGLNERFENAHPGEVLAWAWEAFDGSLAASSSFGTQSVPLLHLVSRHAPEMPVYFLDTDFHFPETLAYRDRLAAELGLNVVTLTPKLGHASAAPMAGSTGASPTHCFPVGMNLQRVALASSRRRNSFLRSSPSDLSPSSLHGKHPPISDRAVS